MCPFLRAGRCNRGSECTYAWVRNTMWCDFDVMWYGTIWNYMHVLYHGGLNLQRDGRKELPLCARFWCLIVSMTDRHSTARIECHRNRHNNTRCTCLATYCTAHVLYCTYLPTSLPLHMHVGTTKWNLCRHPISERWGKKLFASKSWHGIIWVNFSEPVSPSVQIEFGLAQPGFPFGCEKKKR